MTHVQPTLTRAEHDERIHYALSAYALTQDRTFLDLMDREMARCEDYGCFDHQEPEGCPYDPETCCGHRCEGK